MTNLAANHQDTRIIIKQGLTVDDQSGELGLRGVGDSSMLESFDSKQMVRNLCASQRYHQMTHFLTFTCNMRKHFGTKPIKHGSIMENGKKKIQIFMNFVIQIKKNTNKVLIKQLQDYYYECGRKLPSCS